MNHGADEAIGGDGRHTGEASETGTAKKTVKNGFGLVGLVVTEGDGAKLQAGARFGKESTAGVAGELFHVAGADGGVMDFDGQSELRRQFTHEDFVGVGFGGAEVMVHVEDGDLVAGKAVKDVEEGDRIGTGGDANAHAVISR
jgi:hypothetical protein